jgi:hypothetical protein
VTKDIRHVVVCDMCGGTTPYDNPSGRWFILRRPTGEQAKWDPLGIRAHVPKDSWAICSPQCLGAFVNLMLEDHD